MWPRGKTQAIVLIAIASLCACAEEPAGPMLLLSANRQYLGGTVTVDGAKWGELGEYMFNTGIIGMYHRWRYPDSPMSELVGINLAVGAAAVPSGVHRIEVSKLGLPTQSIEFAYPFREASEVCMVTLLSDSALVSKECEVSRGAG